jgi:hypothetical protein
MIHPITPIVNNTAIYYGAKLATDKNSSPKTDVTNSSASAAARGDDGKAKTGITGSSAKEFAGGTPPALETKPIKNIPPATTIAAATVSSNTPSVDLSVIVNAKSEKEFSDAKAGKTEETPALKAKEALQTKDALKVIASQERNFPSIITLKNSISAETMLSAYKK